MAPPFSARRPIPGIQPFSRGGGRSPRHAFPPIIPASVSCNCGAAYPPLRGSCEFFGFSHLPFAKKFCKDLRPGTGGRLCSPNLRFWRPTLSIELHPYMCASRLIVTRRISAPIAELWRSFQRALSFSLRNCATLRSSGSDPASGGTSRPCPALALRAACPSLAVTSPFLGCLCSACPRLSGVSAPWPLERSALQGQPRKAFLRFAPGYYLSPDCGEASQGGGLNWLRERCGLPSP